MCLFPRDIHGYVLWCRKGYFSAPMPLAKSRSVSLDLQNLQLEQPPAAQPLRPRYVCSVSSRQWMVKFNMTLLTSELRKTHYIYVCLDKIYWSQRKKTTLQSIIQHLFFCFQSNPPPVPLSRMSHRRHTLHTKDADKPADTSIHGITGAPNLSLYTATHFFMFHCFLPVIYLNSWQLWMEFLSVCTQNLMSRQMTWYV